MQLELFEEFCENPEDEMIEKGLLGGSGFVDGKKRIYNFSLTGPSKEDFAVFLKNEYGIGGRGCCANQPYTIKQEFHDSKGIRFGWLDGDGNEIEQNITWQKGAETILSMVKRNVYI